MPNVQVRNVPQPVLEALRAEAEQYGQSMQQHLLSVLEAHTARLRRNALFVELDAAVGEEPFTDDVDSADAIRADRDARDGRGDE